MKLKIIFLSIFFVYPAWAKNCLKNRAVIEMGSFSTKVIMASVDTCKNKIQEINYQTKTTLNFKENLTSKRPRSIKESFLKTARVELKKIYLSLSLYSPEETILLAPTFFKEITNAQPFLKELKKKYKFKVLFLSSKTSSILGFISTLTQTGGNPEQYSVWDIGASGLTLTVFDKKIYHVYTDNMSSIHFKNMVLKGIQNSDAHSPNPLKEKDAQKAIKMIRLHTKFGLKDEFLKLLKNRILLGIGGSHFYTLENLISKKKHLYSLDEIKEAIISNQNKNDAELDIPFPDVQVTNLIMIYGQMLEFGLNKLITIKTDKTFGALFYSKFWN